MKRLVVLVALAIVAMVLPVWAGDVEINVMPMTSVEGLDLDEGVAGKVWDEWNYTEAGEVTWDELVQVLVNSAYNENYGLSLSPLVVIPKSNTLYGGKVSLGLDGMIHVGGWTLSGAGSKSGAVPGFQSYQIYSYEDGMEPGRYWWTATGEGEYSVGLVEMWDEVFASYRYEYNSETGGKFYPDKMKTSYDLSRNFNLSTYYAGVSFSQPLLMEGIRLGLGARNISYSIDDVQHVHGGFHEQYSWANGCDGYTESSVLHNEWDLVVTPFVSFNGFGPMVFATFTRPMGGKLSVNGGVSGSLVFGQVDETGNFVDIDKGYSLRTLEADDWLSIEDREDWEIVGKVPFAVSYTTNIPVIEANFGVNYEISPSVSLGLSYQKSWWKNVPQPPKFHYNGCDDGFWTYGEKSDVAAGGYGVSLTIKF